MSYHRIRTRYICRRALAALLVLGAVVACDRAGPPDLPAEMTGTLTPAVWEGLMWVFGE